MFLCIPNLIHICQLIIKYPNKSNLLTQGVLIQARLSEIDVIFLIVWSKTIYTKFIKILKIVFTFQVEGRLRGLKKHA